MSFMFPFLAYMNIFYKGKSMTARFFSTWCGYCFMLGTVFTTCNITFTLIDIIGGD